MKRPNHSRSPRSGISTLILAVCGIVLALESGAGESIFSETATTAADAAAGRPPPAGMFLVATRALGDAHFGRSVVYLLDHGDDGTLGLIVNRPGESSLFEAVPDLADDRAAAHSLYYGGPVGLPMIMMLLRSDRAAEGMAYIVDDVYVSSERGVIEAALAAGKSASELRFFIGYSGWAGGQLDGELERGSWHVVPGDPDAIFSGDADTLWQRLIDELEPEGIQVRYRRPPLLPAAAA